MSTIKLIKILFKITTLITIQTLIHMLKLKKLKLIMRLANNNLLMETLITFSTLLIIQSVKMPILLKHNRFSKITFNNKLIVCLIKINIIKLKLIPNPNKISKLNQDLNRLMSKVFLNRFLSKTFLNRFLSKTFLNKFIIKTFLNKAFINTYNKIK